MRKRRILKTIILIISILLVVFVLTGNYLVNFALVRKDIVSEDIVPSSTVTTENQEIIQINRENIRKQKEEWLLDIKPEEVEIISEDGLKLRGDIFKNQNENHKWVIAVHGYTGKRADMQNVASFYGLKGYHVLTPDMRSHGESEGTYIGMGWLDRKDLLLWIQYIIAMDEKAEIVLHGISMGGATVMMTAGEELPVQVKAVIEDCGYTSVWDIFSDELEYVFGLPEFPVLYAADIIASLRAGYNFKSASALKQVAKSKVPILFIHGSEDTFVHTDMVYELYDACPTSKDLLIIEGAGHGEAYAINPELYFSTIFEFLERLS